MNKKQLIKAAAGIVLATALAGSGYAIGANQDKAEVAAAVETIEDHEATIIDLSDELEAAPSDDQLKECFTALTSARLYQRFQADAMQILASGAGTTDVAELTEGLDKLKALVPLVKQSGDDFNADAAKCEA